MPGFYGAIRVRKHFTRKFYFLFRPTVVLSRMNSRRTCAVCLDDKDLKTFHGRLTLDCWHPARMICSDCVIQHVQHTFQITFTDDVFYPEQECGARLGYVIGREILASNNDQTLVDRYERYVLHREMEQMEEFIWCSNPQCNGGQLNEGGAFNNIVTCYSCRQKTCFTHKVRWHEGLTCKEYSRSIDKDNETSQRWILTNSKKCPKCPFRIEKNGGCDHMTCIKCRHEFCWSCLADFEPIRRDGNHQHESSCKHYAPYPRTWRRLGLFWLSLDRNKKWTQELLEINKRNQLLGSIRIWVI